MGSTPGNSITMKMRRTRQLWGKAQRKSSSRMRQRKMASSPPLPPPRKVSEKLMALNNLINPLHTSGEVKTDELFQETANYILLLKTQVSILQKLVEFYGSSGHDEQVQQNQNVAV